jgi:hypothetical protein
MRQLVTEIFKFDELTPESQLRAIEYYREANLQWLWEDVSNDCQLVFCQYLHERGYPTWDIRWSLSCSQGDGVAFYSGGKSAPEQRPFGPILEDSSTDLDIQRLWFRGGLWRNFTKEQRRDIYRVWGLLREDLRVRINKSQRWSRYDHQNTMVVEVELDRIDPDEYAALAPGLTQATLYDWAESAQEWIQQDVRQVSGELESQGDRIQDERLSGECIAEEIRERDEQEFESDGSLYHG